MLNIECIFPNSPENRMSVAMNCNRTADYVFDCNKDTTCKMTVKELQDDRLIGLVKAVVQDLGGTVFITAGKQ